MRIDAHQHFWHYDPSHHVWMTPAMKTLQRDFLPADIKPLLEQNGIDGTIAVQAVQSTAETDWLLKLADTNDQIRGVIGWVDLRSPDLQTQLAIYQRRPRLRGIRHNVHDEPNDQWLLDSRVLKGISLLPSYNLTYDLLLFPRHLPVAVQVVNRFPRGRFVLDHIAKPAIKDHVVAPWEAGIRALARYENVYCKLSGMVTEADWAQWQIDDFKRYLDIVFDCFGPDRLMFGSDWPVCTLAASYGQVVDIISSYLAGMPGRTDAIWGANAARCYSLTDESTS
ncbi:MAG: amidohydrolase family protein [Herpetosiphon sp.]